MNNSNSLVSVVIAAHDAERYLADAIESVLAQTHDQVELVVVDDGSEDGTAGVAHSYGSQLRYRYQAWAGAGAGRNRGVEMAAGGLIAFLDADDLFPPERLERQVQAFERDPSLDAVFGRVAEFRSDDADGRSLGGRRPVREPVASHLPTAMLIRRRAFDRVGPFTTELTLGEGIDWYARALDVGITTRMLPDVVLHRRLHEGSLGMVSEGSRDDYVRVVKTTLDRRRGRARS
jgi:glycosyltransferase involved in cell wall biosynthesis